MKETMVSLARIMSLAACNGADYRTHDMPAITDSVSCQTPADTHMRRNDTTPTTNNNIYNSDSAASGNGVDSSSKHTQKTKKS